MGLTGFGLFVSTGFGWLIIVLMYADIIAFLGYYVHSHVHVIHNFPGLVSFCLHGLLEREEKSSFLTIRRNSRNALCPYYLLLIVIIHIRTLVKHVLNQARTNSLLSQLHSYLR